MSDLKDILQNEHGKLPEDKLIAYFEGSLSPEEQHEVELWLAEDGMESDALEGLKALSPEDTRRTVAALNVGLQHRLARDKRKGKKMLKSNFWGLIAVVVILLLVVMAFIVIKIMHS